MCSCWCVVFLVVLVCRCWNCGCVCFVFLGGVLLFGFGLVCWVGIFGCRIFWWCFVRLWSFLGWWCCCWNCCCWVYVDLCFVLLGICLVLVGCVVWISDVLVLCCGCFIGLGIECAVLWLCCCWLVFGLVGCVCDSVDYFEIRLVVFCFFCCWVIDLVLFICFVIVW